MTTTPDIDLNLMRLLATLYDERSVTRAAERLCITPSAVSHALRRLRLLFGDSLFVRGPHGMIPTPRAHDAATRLRALLPQLSDVISPPAFDETRTERVFAIACVPYLASILVPELATRFGTGAPHARLDIRMMYGSMVDDLDSGALDVVLGNFRKIPSRLMVEELLRDPYRWVIARSNPNAGEKLTVHTLGMLPHVELLIDSATAHPVDSYDARQGLERLVIQDNLAAADRALASKDMRRHVRFHAPDSISAMAIVARTDATCLVSGSAAEKFADALDLKVFGSPFLTDPLVIQMLYHRDHADRPAVRWLLGHIRDSASTT